MVTKRTYKGKRNLLSAERKEFSTRQHTKTNPAIHEEFAQYAQYQYQQNDEKVKYQQQKQISPWPKEKTKTKFHRKYQSKKTRRARPIWSKIKRINNTA